MSIVEWNDVDVSLMQGVGSAVNKLNNVVAMIAEVRSIADSLAPTAAQLSRPDSAFLNL